MAQQGIYDTQGRLFGYLDGSAVYDLSGVQMGEIRREGKRRTVYTLDGEKVWRISGDGLYTLSWEPVGYVGERYHDPEETDY